MTVICSGITCNWSTKVFITRGIGHFARGIRGFARGIGNFCGRNLCFSRAESLHACNFYVLFQLSFKLCRTDLTLVGISPPESPSQTCVVQLGFPLGHISWKDRPAQSVEEGYESDKARVMGYSRRAASVGCRAFVSCAKALLRQKSRSIA